MKTYKTPITKTAIKSFYFGTLKTLISGKIGDTFTVIGETKTYYITTNERNNKLPKCFVDNI
jgi:hypothetical protein